MDYVVHLLLFSIAAVVIWLVAGGLIDIIDRVAKRFHRSSFTLSFFILGVLTSLSEISVAVNSSLAGVPQVSVGNLIGASLVLVLLIIPFLAIFGNGIRLVDSFSRPIIVLWSLVVVLPVVMILDGSFSGWESIVLFIAYGALLFAMRGRKTVGEILQGAEEAVADRFFDRTKTVHDSIKICIGAAVIFLSARVLVTETIYFATVLSVPASFIGLMVLAIGTNVPELVIATRSIQKKEKDIAFGDYMGSAAVNTATIAFLGVLNGSFRVEATEFFPSFILLVIGLLLFMVFSNSRRTISRREGLGLFAVYGVYLLWQFMNLLRFLGD